MKSHSPGEKTRSRQSQRARDKRMAKSQSRSSRARHRSPSPIETAPGGPRRDPSPVYDYVKTYAVNGEKKLFTRVVDDEKDGLVILWGRGRRHSPQSPVHTINGRSDKTRRHSPGRTLRPGSDYEAPAFLPPPDPPKKDGWGLINRSESFPRGRRREY